jgi:hypothetical protein
MSKDKGNNDLSLANTAINTLKFFKGMDGTMKDFVKKNI